MSIQQLKEQPDPGQINRILDSLNGKHSMDVCTALVRYTIPETYDILDRPLQIKVCKVLAHIQGLGMLITELDRGLKEYEDGYEYRGAPNLQFLMLCSVVADLFSDELVSVDWANMTGSAAELQQLNGFLYGGRLFNSMCFALDKYKTVLKITSKNLDDLNWIWLTRPESYGKWIGQLISRNSSPKALEKAMKLGPEITKYLAETLLGPNLQTTQKAYGALRHTQQWFFIQHVVLPWWLESRTRPRTDNAHVIQLFVNNGNGNEAELYKYLETHIPDNLSRNDVADGGTMLDRYVTLVELSKPTTERVQNLIEKWGNENTVKHVPINVQGSMTRLLLLTLRVLDRNQTSLLATSPAFLNGISNRLAGISSRVRMFGTVFAEELTKKAQGKPIDFKLELNATEEDELRMLADPSWRPKPTEKEGVSDDDNEEQHDNKIDQPTARPVTLTPYTFPEDDQEDSDDDPTLAQKENILPPVYIRDLISYLSTEDNYEKQRLALEHGANLVARKRTFGREVVHYATGLASVVASLQNKFEMNDFDSLKLNLLVEIARCEEAAKHLAGLTFTGDYSLQQRLVILTALALSTAQPPESSELLPSKALPGKVELLFQNEASAQNSGLIDTLAAQIQTVSLKDTKVKVEDNEQISGPKVLRISKKLLNEQEERKMNKKKTDDNERTMVGESIFFALLGQWYNNDGSISIGNNYSQLFISHYLKTLAITMSRARRIQIPDMTSELLELLLSLRTLAASEAQVNEGLLTVLALILQTNEPKFLVTHWPNEIMEFQSWLQDTWQEIPDEKVQQTAAAILYQLVEIIDKWKMRLIGASIEMGGY